MDVILGTKYVNGHQVELEFHDISGDESVGASRKVQYEDSDIFLICVPSTSRESFNNLQIWKDEIQSVEPRKAIFLVLTKCDLVNFIEDPVTFE